MLLQILNFMPVCFSSSNCVIIAGVKRIILFQTSEVGLVNMLYALAHCKW